MRDLFIDYCVRKLLQSFERIESCLLALSDEQIWWRGAEMQNSIANLMLHLCGNLAHGSAPV